MKSSLLLPLALVPLACHRPHVPEPLPDLPGQVQAEVWFGYTFLEPHSYFDLSARDKASVRRINRDLLASRNLICGGEYVALFDAVGVSTHGELGFAEEDLTAAVNGLLTRLETGLAVADAKYSKHECINGSWRCKIEYDLFLRSASGYELFATDYRTPAGPLHSVFDVTLVIDM